MFLFIFSSEANWSGSALFTKTGHDVFSKRRVKKFWTLKFLLYPYVFDPDPGAIWSPAYAPSTSLSGIWFSNNQKWLNDPALWWSTAATQPLTALNTNEWKQGSKLTEASSKFVPWKFSLLPGQTVGSKTLLSGIVPWTLSTLCCECLQWKSDLTLHVIHLSLVMSSLIFAEIKKILWKCCLLYTCTCMLSAWRFNPWHWGNTFCCHVDAFCYLHPDQVAASCYLRKKLISNTGKNKRLHVGLLPHTPHPTPTCFKLKH